MNSGIVARALPTPRQRLLRQRQHGAILQQHDRRELERAGWRTTLEFRENNTRGRDGRLLQVEEIWHAEAERDRTGRGEWDGVDFIHATAESVDEVWSKLRRQAELAELRGRDLRADRSAEQAS
jgi:hypothetical protein